MGEVETVAVRFRSLKGPQGRRRAMLVRVADLPAVDARQ